MRPTTVSALAIAVLVAIPAAGTAAGTAAGSSDPCSAALAQAWEELGHFSDAKETWMLTTDLCRPSPPAAPAASQWEGRPV